MQPLSGFRFQVHFHPVQEVGIVNYVFIKGTFVDGTCFLKKGINKHFWFLYVVCNNNTYGPECALKCGNCSNGETCHHINGTCFNGCAEGALGDTCQGGSGFGYLSIFKSTQYNHEKLNEIHVNNINNSWDKKMLQIANLDIMDEIAVTVVAKTALSPVNVFI